jgi:amino acid transporter
MTDITQYIPMLMTMILVLTIITNIIVQVLKGLLYEKVPTNLLAFIVSVVVTVLSGIAAQSYYKIAVTGWMIAGMIAVCFLVAFSAMFGYDKLVQMVEQIQGLKGDVKNK